MPTTLRPVLGINRAVTASVLDRAYAVHKGFLANPARFTAPNPPLADLEAQIVSLEQADKQVRTRTFGAAKVRDLERARLAGMLHTQCAYVRTLCDASPEEAAVIIQAAGMISAAAPLTVRPLLQVTRGSESGTAVLDAAVHLLMGGPSRRSKILHWQWTTDGGASFHDAPVTPGGKTTITGLTPFTMVGFRVKLTTLTSLGEWTPVVSILIL